MEAVTSPNDKKQGNFWIIAGVIGLVLTVLAAIVYFAFFYNKPSKSNTGGETKTESTSSAQPKESQENLGWVTPLEGLNLRSEASTESNILLLLPNGTEVKIINTEGDWYFVEANTKGFVAKEFITLTEPSSTILKTFKKEDSPITFLYPSFYNVDFKKEDKVLTYSFNGNDSFGGFKIETEEGHTTLGNYAIINYPGSKPVTCDVQFAASRRGCEKVETASGTIYLVLFENTLYKISYLPTQGGVLTDINNLVFFSFVVK